MLICFLRHAEAEDEASSDFARKLTPKGLEQAAKVGRFLSRAGLVPDVILSSPVIRAHQTAQIVATAMDRKVLEVPWLACGMHPVACLEEIVKCGREKSLLLVGHEPDISRAIGHLVGLKTSQGLNIRKASIAGVTLDEEQTGELQFFVPVRLM